MLKPIFIRVGDAGRNEVRKVQFRGFDYQKKGAAYYARVEAFSHFQYKFWSE